MQTFRIGAFGDDDFMSVASEVIVGDLWARTLADGCAIDQVLGRNKGDVLTKVELSAPIPDLHTVLGRYPEDALIAQSTGRKFYRGEWARAIDGAAPNPANWLIAIITGEHAVTDAQVFNRTRALVCLDLCALNVAGHRGWRVRERIEIQLLATWRVEPRPVSKVWGVGKAVYVKNDLGWLCEYLMFIR